MNLIGNSEEDIRSRSLLTGLQIGDALAMPAHWYYNQSALRKDYGEIDRFMAPKNPHPDSILWRSKYTPLNRKGEILHDQAKYWGRRGVHYHQFLEAGENTLNAKLCHLLWKSLIANKGWNGDNFLQQYIHFMVTPRSHGDTYVEECHRNFFSNYAAGVQPRACAEPEKHVGGLCFLFPVLAWYQDDFNVGRRYAMKQLSLLHPGRLMEEGARIILDIYERILEGDTPKLAAEHVIERQNSFLVKRPWDKWINQDTRNCLEQEVGLACYIERAVPAILYLLLKHGNDPRQALIENTMAGGDNAHRGMPLGGLLGAAFGQSAFPGKWVRGLKESFVSPQRDLVCESRT